MLDDTRLPILTNMNNCYVTYDLRDCMVLGKPKQSTKRVARNWAWLWCYSFPSGIEGGIKLRCSAFREVNCVEKNNSPVICQSILSLVICQSGKLVILESLIHPIIRFKATPKKSFANPSILYLLSIIIYPIFHWWFIHWFTGSSWGRRPSRKEVLGM